MGRVSRSGGDGPQSLDTLPGAPWCVVKTKWPPHKTDAAASGSLQQAYDYLSTEGKGPNGTAPVRFASTGPTRSFLAKCLAGKVTDPMGAWQEYISTENIWPEGKYKERQHYRLMLSPEAAFWRRVEAQGRGEQSVVMEEVTKTVMAQLNNAANGELVWTAAVHVNTKRTHAHCLIRGKDADARSVFLPPNRRIRHIARWALMQALKTQRAGLEAANVG